MTYCFSLLEGKTTNRLIVLGISIKAYRMTFLILAKSGDFCSSLLFITNFTAKYPEVSFKIGNCAKSLRMIVTNSGLTFWTKKSFIKLSCSGETSNSSIVRMFSVSSFASISLKICKLSDCCLITISVISFSNCWAEIPPRIFSPDTPVKLNLLIAAKRTLKNSSKLLEKIPKNRNLSNSGTDSSAAS
ncbi:hypothetical protein D3C80_1284350 [compost metagenome]